MDVVALNQAGFENAVATLGTALTLDQASLIAKNASKKEVIVSYDSDEAGRAAAQRAIKIFAQADPDVSVSILNIEGAKDPDEYIKKFGAQRFRLLLDSSENATEFELKKCKDGLDLSKEADKAKYLKKVLYVLAEIPSPIDREVYISKIADEQDVGKDVLRSQVARLMKSREKSEKDLKWSGITARTVNHFSDDVNPDAKKYPKEDKAERGILAYLFDSPERLDEILKKVPPDKFVTAFNKKVYSAFAEKAKNTEHFSISVFADEFSNEEMGKISEIIAKSRDITITDEVVEDYIRVVLSHDDGIGDDENLSDDDFLKKVEKMKKK